jgi:hypothetical protein
VKHGSTSIEVVKYPGQELERVSLYGSPNTQVLLPGLEENRRFQFRADKDQAPASSCSIWLMTTSSARPRSFASSGMSNTSSLA